MLWELWVDGIASAMALRPESWSSITDSGEEEGGAALAEMTMFVEVASGDSALMSHEINDLSGEAPARIGAAVLALHAWRLRKGGTPAAGHRAGAKVDRNEVCPCGSDKKYKRCCG